MRGSLQQALVARGSAGLALVIVGSAAFASNGLDDWGALAALVAHLAGLVFLYAAIRLYMNRFGGRRLLQPRGPQSITGGCIIAFVRGLLILLMVAGFAFWLWFAAVDVNEIRLLLIGGRVESATVIGRDIPRPYASTGFVNYSYRVTSTVAPVGKFAVPIGALSRYPTGLPIDITYARSAPAVHRIGRVDMLFLVRRICYWLLLLGNGAAYLFLPLWLLEFRRARKSS